MRNIAYLIKESSMGYFEIMDLPYAVFLSLLKHFRIFELEQTEKGRKLLKQSEFLNQTEPDWIKLRGQKSYKKVKNQEK